MDVEKPAERANATAPGSTPKRLLDAAGSSAGLADRLNLGTGAPLTDQAPAAPSHRSGIPWPWPGCSGHPVSFVFEEGQRALTFLILANAVYGGLLVMSLPLAWTRLVSYRGPENPPALPRDNPVLMESRPPNENLSGAPIRAGLPGRRRPASGMSDQQPRSTPSKRTNRTARRAKASG